MRVFDYELSQIEVGISAAVIAAVILLIMYFSPKWLRLALAVVLIGGGVLGALWHQGELSQQPAQFTEKKLENQPPAGGASSEKQEETPLERQTESAEDQKVRKFNVEPAAGPEKQEKFETVDVLYGTDRSKAEDVQRIRYGDGRGKQLALGRATVTVPKKAHNTGEIERPFEFNFLWIKYSAAEDPEKHFTIHKIGEISREEFKNLSREMMSKSSRFKDQAFVFIHGYNVSFDAALYRTAQMAYDLGFDGVPYMYSWPSIGGITNYEYDQNSSQQARPYLRDFLDMVTKESGAKDVHIVAHSMGNGPVMEVLRDLRLRPDSERVSNINQVILAAPDIDRDVFINLASEIKGLSKGITLYVSSADLAMKASRTYSGSVRAGDVPETGPIIIEGIDTIDVTKLSTSMFSLNHSLYADSGKILSDITKIMLSHIRPPDIRTPELQRVDNPGGTIFWRYDQ